MNEDRADAIERQRAEAIQYHKEAEEAFELRWFELVKESPDHKLTPDQLRIKRKYERK